MNEFIAINPIPCHIANGTDIISAKRTADKPGYEFCKIINYDGEYLVAYGHVDLNEFLRNYIWYVVCEQFGYGSPKEFIKQTSPDGASINNSLVAEMIFLDAIWGFIDSRFKTPEEANARFTELTKLTV